MTSPRRPSTFLILFVALLSGATCLIYELIWSRYLSLILGVSVHAVAIVLTCFMLGLAAGSWAGGLMADRVRKPAHALRGLMAGIAICVLASPTIYRLSDGQLALPLAAMLITTFLMGGLLPIMVKLATPTLDAAGLSIGRLYAVNTLGGAIGAFAAGFHLIPTIGLAHSLHVASGLSLLACVLAIGISAPPSRDEPEKPKKGKTVAPIANSAAIVSAVVLVVGISGFTGLCYEVYWTRILTWFFRDTIYDLTIVLTAFLIGLVFGSLIAGRFGATTQSAALWLGATQILIGTSCFAGIALMGRFPYWINYLQTNAALADRYGQDFWLAGNAIRFGYAFLLILIPTSLMGAALPLAGRACVQSIDGIGRTFGAICAINTLGSAIGPLAAAFIFIPWLGMQQSMALNVMLNILCGLLVLGLVARISAWWLGTGLILAALVVTSLAPPWDALRMSTSFLNENQPIDQLLDLKFYREDAYGLTSVVDLPSEKRRYLITNRLFAQNTSDMMGLEDHRRLGLIPILLHPSPKSALAVGLGAGITLRGIADSPVQSVDCVEISHSVIDAASFFSEQNGNVTKNPKVRMITDDGRHFMRASAGRYDVIVLDILFPMSSGSGTAFSREYFELCKSRLNSGGMICQWLPVHQLSLGQLKSIIATFQSVYPHTSLWLGMIGDSQPVIGCIGTAGPLRIDVEALAARLNHPAVAVDLKETLLNRPGLFLSHFIMDEKEVAGFCKGSPLDTDDRPVIEFAAPKLSQRASALGVANLVVFGRAMVDISPLLTAVPSDLSSCVAAKQAIIESTANPQEQYDRLLEALDRMPENADLLYLVREMEREQ